jgi:cytoskeletal protein CcmA (bactofilin family)
MKKALYIAVAVALIVPLVGFAATVKGGKSYSLAKGETITDDLYAAGGNVTIAGNVMGDAVVSGGMVIVTGNIQQDVLIAGGNLSVLGPVGDDVRAAGGNITISAPVAGDVLAAGGQVVIASGADVGKDAVLAGGSITIDGHVKGKVDASGGEVTINGTVDGNVSIKSGRVILGEHAVINGSLSYQSLKQATIATGAVIKGQTNYQQLQGASRGQIARARIFGGIFKVIMLFISAWVLHLIFRRRSTKVIARPIATFWWHLLWGFISIIIIPIAAVILMVTVVGIPLGIITLIGYFLLLALSWIITPVIIGSLVYMWWEKSRASGNTTMVPRVNWETILLGVLVFTIVGYIPVIGWLVNCVFMLVAFGTLVKGIVDVQKR